MQEPGGGIVLMDVKTWWPPGRLRRTPRSRSPSDKADYIEPVRELRPGAGISTSTAPQGRDAASDPGSAPQGGQPVKED